MVSTRTQKGTNGDEMADTEGIGPGTTGMARKPAGIVAAKRFFPCKGVVFDKDGTLIDIFPLLSALGHERLRHLAARVRHNALASVERCMGFDSKTGEVSPLGPLAGATRRDEVAVTACALWLEGIPWYQAISIAKEAYDQADATLDVTKDAYLLPGAHSCVTSLAESGLTLFIATSDGHERAENMLDSLGILGYFHSIVAADDVTEPKPSPESVLVCANRLGISPEELVVVGDAPQDAIMARRAGCKSIGVLTGVSSFDMLEGYCDLVLPGVLDIRPAPRE